MSTTTPSLHSLAGQYGQALQNGLPEADQLGSRLAAMRIVASAKTIVAHYDCPLTNQDRSYIAAELDQLAGGAL